MARNVYMAIMKAAAQGVGLRLTAEECIDLSMDDAIETVAHNHLTHEQFSKLPFDWSKVNTNVTEQRELDY